jgi:site-specific DNA recombinase
VLYHGTYEPLITPELWQQVQDVLDGRHAKRPKKRTHEFAFSGLITCGHCGCAMVGEIKKGRYVYYHCTGYKGKCPEPYTREEVLEKGFTNVLQGISFSTEVLAWVTTALRESHLDEKQFHDEAISKLQREHGRLQDRIDAMYTDKLDGRIDNVFFDRKAGEVRDEQCRITRDIEAHQTANRSYIEEGIRLLELSQRAAELFESQPASEKRKLLDFVLSNSRWKGGKLEAEYRQPFDLIAAAALADRQLKPAAGSGNGNFDEWRREWDSNPR